MTEAEIQNSLYRTLGQRGHWGIVPNFHAFGWECDMFSILKSGRTCEWEIKISRKDFRADFKKKLKHQILSEGARELTTWEKNWPAAYLKGKINAAGLVEVDRPNYFTYCCPPDVIKPEEVPEYAGLMYITGNYFQTDIKRPKLLHKKTYDKKLEDKICLALMYRYWGCRLKKEE
jgi:hypothetical protein